MVIARQNSIGSGEIGRCVSTAYIFFIIYFLQRKNGQHNRRDVGYYHWLGTQLLFLYIYPSLFLQGCLCWPILLRSGISPSSTLQPAMICFDFTQTQACEESRFIPDPQTQPPTDRWPAKAGRVVYRFAGCAWRCPLNLHRWHALWIYRETFWKVFVWDEHP